MTGAEVDRFTARLAAEMDALSPTERSEIIGRISRMRSAMHADGQESPLWRGPAPEPIVLGRDVVFETDRGSRVGRAVCFGILPVGATWERSVIVHVPASGTNHEIPGSQARLADAMGQARLLNESEMAGRLKIAVETAVIPRRPMRSGSKPIPRNEGFLARLLERAKGHPNVLGVEEGGTCHKIVGTNGLRIYLFRTQMRCNLAGFNVAHKAVRCLTADEARSMHLGSVRGQITFDDPTAAEEAFSLALGALGGSTEGT